MEVWLQNKRMEQCKRIGSIKDLEGMEARDQELKNQHDCKTFKQFLRLRQQEQ